MSARKNWMKKPLGFSLLELMVVVAILGVLATVAVPRFNIFRSRARQAEAKANLGQMFTLQESFAIEHEKYYDGVAATWGGSDMNLPVVRDGYRGAGSNNCMNNKLGFRLANCNKARYGYWTAGASETEFLAIAWGESDDGYPEKRIFPGCDGVANSPIVRTNLAPGATLGVTATELCSPTFATATGVTMTAASKGDAWCLDQGRRLNNYFDIVEGCSD